jgi:iron complex transport system substrate-binding protein
MRNFVRIIWALAILWCGFSPGVGTADQPRKVLTITDALGKEVKILAPAQRIVTNGRAAEILCALGAADQIVGVSDHIAQNEVKLLSALKGKPSVGHAAHLSLEKIIELQPDLVIVHDMWQTKEAFEGKLAPLGIPVARLILYRLDTLATEIPILGKIVGREKAAAEYLRYFQNCLNLVKERLRGLKRKTRFYGESFSNLTTYSKKSWSNKVADWAGLENIAADQPVPFPRIASEWVVEKNPEVIVKAAAASFVRMGYGTDNLQAVINFRNELLHRPAWDQIDAVKTGRVYLLAGEIWAGPRAAVGILYMAKWCYPHRFKDIDPEQVHRQWLRKWHHQELKGIYVYP